MIISDLMFARYEEGARGPEAFDCFGLFAELCRRSGTPIPDHPTPADRKQCQIEINNFFDACWQRLDTPEVGCAVALRFGPWVSHLGMVLEGGKFIHANQIAGVTVESLDDAQWCRRIAGFYRYGGCHE